MKDKTYVDKYKKADRMIVEARLLKQKAILQALKQGLTYREMAEDIGGVTRQALSQFVKYK